MQFFSLPFLRLLYYVSVLSVIQTLLKNQHNTKALLQNRLEEKVFNYIFIAL